MPKTAKRRAPFVDRFLNVTLQDVRERMTNGLSPLDVDALCKDSQKLTPDDVVVANEHFLALVRALIDAKNAEDEQ